MTGRKTAKFLLLIPILLLLGISQSYSQSFDFAPYPNLDFSFNHLQLELNINAGQQILEGRAVYEAKANIGGIDTLVIRAARMDIESVRIDDIDAGFHLENDSLFITLNESTRTGNLYSVEVFYRTAPAFGVHFESDGGMWSSFLPLATHHWLPVVDHPRISFTTDITFTLQPGFMAIAPGVKVSEEVSGKEKQVQWRSRHPIPASALWFVTGPFETEETSSGGRQISFSSTDSVESGQALLEESARVIKDVEDRLGMEYPFESLHIIVLEDHRWETKAYGGGTVYLFRNRGNLESQLRRGIYAQWFGVYHREEQWSDAGAMNLYQTVLHYSGSEDGKITVTDSLNPDASVNPYHPFGPEQWNLWQDFYPLWNDSTWKGIINRSLNMVSDGGVRSWRDYADIWYRQSGQSWFQPPDLVLNREEPEIEKDSIIYQVNYHYDEVNNELTLAFHSLDSVFNELVSIPLVQHRGSQTDTLRVTFTGEKDSVLVKLFPTVSYVLLEAGARENLYLKEKKPTSFLLNILRSGESPPIRASAARQLAENTDNPDLQLAVGDLLVNEQDPEVRGALLYALGEITGGATGTEQTFLEAIREENRFIQKVALEALGNYRNNEQAVQALQRYALATDSLALFRSAVSHFAKAADTTAVMRFSRQVMNRDSTGYRALLTLRELSDSLDNSYVVENLDILSGTGYPYAVRSEALQVLTGMDRDAERWESRFQNLIKDPDPRIRFLAVGGLRQVASADAEAVVRERLLDEYDGRVYYEMKALVEDDK